jgi:polar amino acid transport system ATP-binding protein
VSDSFLQYAGLYKAYGQNLVLKNINLVVPEHSVTCLIGPSGCGKSTLLRCTNLLEDVQAGGIWLRGQDLTTMRRDADDIRRRVGMVFQQYNLFPHMTVMQNITLAPRKVLHISRSEAIATAESLLSRFGLADKVNEYPDRLSGGQQQRIAIIRALAMKPELLLLDEITSALDPEMVGEVLDIIVELKALGMTMILATHQMGFARNTADQVVFLDQGEIVEQNDPATFFDHPQHERTRQFINHILTAT